MNTWRIYTNYLRNQTYFLKRRYSLDSEGSISVSLVDGVKTITMCDQKTRNALSMKMMKGLIDNISSNSDDPNLRVIVIASEGKVFSAGHNLRELLPSVDIKVHQKVFQICAGLMNIIMESPVPIIAKVNGIAAASGCQLVAQCDLAICSENSTFMTPGVNFGIFCSTPGVILSRNVPKSTAMKMLLTGKPISAKEAKDAGLVADLCKVDQLDETVDSYCHEIKLKSREVIELGKKFYYEQLNLDVKEALRIGGNIMVKNLQLQDGREGLNSFVEKRKALWTHGGK